MPKTIAAESHSKGAIKVVKSTQFKYAASQDLSRLFEDFRLMCNDAIRIALKTKPKNRFKLQELAIPRLAEYHLHTHYVLSACEVAFSVYRNKERKSGPYIRKAFLTLDNQSYRLNHLLLRIPFHSSGKGHNSDYIFLTLQGSDYHLPSIDDPTLKKGSITLTSSTVSIAFSKEIAEVEPLGTVGIDVNERNVTVSDSSGRTVRYDTSEVAEIKERYKEIRAKIGRRTGRDNRISQRLYSKYGKQEKNRGVQRLHKISKEIVAHARANRFGIVMEKLTGIRRLYRKGNGQGPSYRGRLNSWAFHEIQRQVEYKARWEGISVTYINPRGTSQKCPDCGSHVVPLQERKLFCAQCDKTWDRDVLASKNIMAASVCAVRPPKGSGEGERDGDGSNPRSRWAEVEVSGLVPTT